MGSGRQASSIRAARVQPDRACDSADSKSGSPPGGLDFSPMILLLALRLLEDSGKRSVADGVRFSRT